MAKIVYFPKREHRATSPPKEAENKPKRQRLRRLGRGLATAAWVITASVWPFVGWLVALDVAWQFGQMLYYWDSQGIAASMDFIVHFSVFCIFSYYVANGCPHDHGR